MQATIRLLSERKGGEFFLDIPSYRTSPLIGLIEHGTQSTWPNSRLFVHSDWCRPVKTEADFTDESPTVDQFLRDSSELSSAIEERF